MPNNYCQKHKESLQKEAREKYQNLSEEEKDKRQKKPEKDNKLLQKKKKKKSFSIIVNVIRIFLRNKSRS